MQCYQRTQIKFMPTRVKSQGRRLRTFPKSCVFAYNTIKDRWRINKPNQPKEYKCVCVTNEQLPPWWAAHSTAVRFAPAFALVCVCAAVQKTTTYTSSISSSHIEARVELFTVRGTLSASTQLIHLPTSPVLFNCRERIIIAPLRAPAAAADDWGNREILHGAGADARN